MSTKGYIKIPESQFNDERSEKMKNRTWHNNIMNILLGKNVCGTCLRIEDDLVHWDAQFILLCYEDEIESSLKNIMISTFGPSVTSIIPTTNFCQKCVDTMLSAYMLIIQLRENCKNIQRKLKEISQQMKWTAYLDENGSLTETILNNKVINDDDDLIVDKSAVEKEVKTHTIILNNESLKSKLLQDTEMHKFLITKDDLCPTLAEPKLPEGITVKKVVKSLDMCDFAPHDLLELNWAEDEDESEREPQTSDKLQSNEALIMNLMEEAKTIEKHKHFHDNLNLRVKEALPEIKQFVHDSLSVKLIQSQKLSQTQVTAEQDESYSDTEDLVPQDLLELTWPEEPSDTTQQTKIPVKKLNFNESLTVKFIPAHKLVRVKDVKEMAPQESLELNLNEQEEARDDSIADQKHSIDLTQWLHDQGMSTIKSKNFTHLNNSIQDIDIEEHISKKVKLENKKDTSDNVKKQATGPKGIKCNITVSNCVNLDVLPEPVLDDMNAIRCGLCNLTFVLFDSYWSHYKTHNISETARCYKCTGKFPVIELLVEHLLLVHSEDMAYCTLCYALLKQNKLAKHMVDHHAKKVEIINAASSKPLTTKDGRCKKCNQSAKDYPNAPHVCVFHSACTECTQDCVHTKFLQSYLDQIKDNKIVYKCTDCDYMYKTKQDIIKHANYMHLHIKSHQCVICKLRFSSLNELNKHNYSSHFTCGRCKKVFTEKDQLYTHNCPKQVSYLGCEACGQRFNYEKCLKRHKETAMAVTDECLLCHDSVPNICNMSRHMHAKHQVFLKKEKNTIIYECAICQKFFRNETDFKKHPCLYECKICERRFMNKALHERHLQAHIVSKQHRKCPVCNLEIVDKLSYINHMAEHTDYEKCPICLTYVKKNSLKHHIEIHKGLRNNLKCPHCPLACENSNQYEVHVNRFHLMRRPYQCDICSKAFYGKQKLRDHIKEHTSQRRNAKCPVCDKRFARNETMERHLKLHSRGQLYKCDMCEKMYISAALLEQHRMFIHTDNDSELPKPETSQKSIM